MRRHGGAATASTQQRIRQMDHALGTSQTHITLIERKHARTTHEQSERERKKRKKSEGGSAFDGVEFKHHLKHAIILQINLICA